MKASDLADMNPLTTAPPIVLEALKVQELAHKALQQARSAKRKASLGCTGCSAYAA